MSRTSLVLVLPKLDLFLAVAKRFDSRNVNLPRGFEVAADETPIVGAFRILYDQTRIRASEARPLSLGVPDTQVYFVTEFLGKPLPTLAGRAFWARSETLLQATCDDHWLARRVLEHLHRL